MHTICWRLKPELFGILSSISTEWTPLETETWDLPEWAEQRLDHYQKSSLAMVLDFRITEKEVELK